MSDNSNNATPIRPDATEPATDRQPSSKGPLVVGILAAGLVLALAGNIYLGLQSRDLQQNIARVEAGAHSQIANLSETTAARIAEQQKQSDEVVADKVKAANDSAAAAVRRARAEADKKSAELSREIADAHAVLDSQTGELNALKDTTNSKFTEVSTDVDQVKTNLADVKSNVASTQTQVENTTNDLKRMIGDMGVMSGLIATNSKDLVTLRTLGERNYFEFDLTKGTTKKVGDITLTLKKSDAKRNRFTVEVLADDRRVEKKDKTIDEPVQLYVGGSLQPYEIVVNQVKKDQVSGYLATPKMHLARR
jgi:multidrug efflux pump subunit AcrA (membrane-fusion protein)